MALKFDMFTIDCGDMKSEFEVFIVLSRKPWMFVV